MVLNIEENITSKPNIANELSTTNKSIVVGGEGEYELFEIWFLKLKAVLSQEENTAKLKLFAPKLAQEIVLEFLDSSIFKDYFAKKTVEEFRKNLRGSPEGNFKEAVLHTLTNLTLKFQMQSVSDIVFFPSLTKEKLEQFIVAIDFVAEVFKEFDIDNRQKGVGIVKI